MKMYTAGYTGHDGYPVVLAEGDSIGEVIEALPFAVDVSAIDEYPGKAAIPRIVEAIQKHEGSSGWVRQAPFTALFTEMVSPDSYVVKRRVSGTSLEDVTTEILRRSELFKIEADQCTLGANQTTGTATIPLGTHNIEIHVSLSENGFNISGISAKHDLTTADVETLAIAYIDPDMDVTSVVIRMSPTAEVEYTSRQVEVAEEARLKAIRRAADEGVPQRVLASLTGVSQATIGRWIKDD